MVKSNFGWLEGAKEQEISSSQGQDTEAAKESHSNWK